MKIRWLCLCFGITFILMSATSQAQVSLESPKSSSTIVAEISNQSINIIDQTYISNFLSWDFEPINETVWRARYFVDDTLMTDLKVVENKDIYDKDWETLTDKHFLDTEATFEPYTPTIARDLKDIRDLPKIATVSKDMQFTNIVFNEAQGYGEFYVIFPNGYKDNLTAEFGWGTTTVVTGGFGDQYYQFSWNNQLIYDNYNDRWHLFYIDAGNDIHATNANSSDTTTWNDYGDIAVGTYDYEDFDVATFDNGTTILTYIVFVTGDDRQVYYIRCVPDNNPVFDYLTCGSADIPFYASSSDDCMNPSIAVNSSGCSAIFFDFEDDSESTANEHEAVFLTEGSSGVSDCGNGDWDWDDATDTDFLSIDFASESGYNSYFPTGLYSYNDSDYRLYWVDTDTVGSYDLETIDFSGSSRSLGTQRTLNADIEGSTNFESFAGVVFGGNSTSFGSDDGTFDVDYYKLTSKTDSVADTADTGANNYQTDGFTGTMTALVDTRGIDADDIYVFGHDSADVNDIFLANSSDGGSTWGVSVWQDEIITPPNFPIYFTSGYDNNCTMMIRFTIGGDVIIDTYETDNCIGTAAPADSCTYTSGDWPIDCSDWCQITAVTDLSTDKLICVGSGEVYINAEVTFGSFVIGDGCRVVLGANGKMVKK